MLETCPACRGLKCGVCNFSGLLTEEEADVYRSWHKWKHPGSNV